MDALKERIAKVKDRYPGMAGLDETELERLFGTSREVSIPAGVQLFRESEPCHMMMWLSEGTIRVYKHSPEGREITLYRVRPGEFCILTLQCLFCGGGFPAEAQSETQVTGIALNRQAIDQAIDEAPGFRRYLLGLLSRRMAEMIHLISEVSFNRLDLRLACLLGQMFEQSGRAPIRITHAQLARELGTTREVISRILKEFENRQCIRLQRGEIHLVSEEDLEWFSRSA